jgi:hypothetical protein
MDWININDKLPNEGQVVDIWARYSEHVQWQKESILEANPKGWEINEDKLSGWRVTDVEYYRFHDGDVECNAFKKNKHSDFIVENREVTHWMPLPKSPKENQ